MPTSQRLRTIDALRGLAALAVVWYHITVGETGFLTGSLRESGQYMGVVGVYGFFVISGFIIPWALYRAGYTHASFGRFLVKRMARLDPPYLASILFIFALDAVVRHIPGFAWHLHPVSAGQLLAHLGYLNALFGYQWINNVYWTLGIELQYYILMALVFPIAMALPHRSRWLVPLVLVLAAWLPRPRLGGDPTHDDLIIKYLGIFAIGFLCFLRKTEQIDWREFLVMLALATVAVWWRLDRYDALSASAAALAIGFLTLGHPALIWLGECSYSLYLFHEPVRWIAYAALRSHTAPGTLGRDLVAFGTLIVAVAVGRAMYLLVERPSQRLASRLKYVRDQAPDPALAQPQPAGQSPVAA